MCCFVNILRDFIYNFSKYQLKQLKNNFNVSIKKVIKIFYKKIKIYLIQQNFNRNDINQLILIEYCLYDADE